MHIYECPYGPTEIKDIPELDCWTGLLGNTDRGIPDDKPLIIDATTGSQFSYGQGRKLALQLADGLRNTAGLKAGDVVCLFSPNSALYPIVCMAIQAAGLVATLANPTYTQNEFLHQLRDSSAKLVLAGSDLLPPALQAANEAGVPNDRIYALPGMDGKVKSGAQSYEKLISKTLWEHEPIRGADLDRAAYLPYSSGTTGLPKGVNVSHRNVIAMSEMLVVTPDLVKQDTVVMGVLPMCHIFAITMTMHHPLRMGATIVILPKFDLAAFLSNIEKYKCTFTCIVPPMALALARHPIVDKANLSSLKEIICGAAPLSADLAAEVTKRVKVPLHQGWGMTETTAASTVNRPGRDKHGSTGQLLPGQQARIVKEDGRDAEVGRDGELWVRGPNIVKSYHNNQKATKGTFTEGGWLMTGDVGFFDAEGYLKIIDRTKELIKYKGYQVAPAELEAILLTCELVADAAVIGVWSENDASELPRAYVVLSDKGKADASHKKSIQTFVQDRVAPSKRLRGGVHTIDVIPKSLSGKILRKDLRTMAAKEGQTKAKL